MRICNKIKAITTLCFIAITLFAATGCDKHKDELYLCVNKVENICGKVENASKFSDVVRVNLIWSESDNRYCILAHGDRKDDDFTITLPETLDLNFLQQSLILEGYSINIASPSTMTVSNPNFKAYNDNTFSLLSGKKIG